MFCSTLHSVLITKSHEIGIAAHGAVRNRFEDQRRLAAIMAADVANYSRLMGTDEVGTAANALKAHRQERLDPALTRHHGRIVKTTGDGLLVEFASVVDVTACAVAIQKAILAFNAGVHEERRIVLRVGINVGDIIIDGNDIFGDGVNVAARLEEGRHYANPAAYAYHGRPTIGCVTNWR